MRFRISDTNNTGVLNFDLKDILTLIKGVDKIEWCCSFIEVEAEKNNYFLITNLIDKINNSDNNFNLLFSDLFFLANRINQTIDCKIIGKRGEDDIIIEAIDSSYWEIELNGNYFTSLKSKFDDKFSKLTSVPAGV